MLEKLCNTMGVSGLENEVRDLIIEEIKPYADSIKIDRMGNVIAFKKGSVKSPVIMLAAHMDEVGFMISEIKENGYLKFRPAGGIDKRVLIGKRVQIGKDRVPGVIIFKPIHVQGKDRTSVPEASSLFIDIGCKDDKDALKYVSIGDYAMFDTKFEKKGKIIKGKAFDDRLGCYAIMEILKKKTKNSYYAVFTVQEETGLRGASAAANNIMPDYGIILEGTSAADVPNEKEDEADYPKLSEGVAITIADRSAFSSRELIEKAKEIADKEKIKYQMKQPMIGGTDAGRIHLAGTGAKTIVLAVPSRYIHSPVGYAHMDDLNAMIALGHKLIDSVN